MFVESDVMEFDGSSSVLYKFSPNSSQAPKDKLSLKFKTMLNSGTLIHMERTHGPSITVELVMGKLQVLVHLNKGNECHFS